MKIQLTKVQLFMLMFVMQTGFVYTSFQNLIIEHGRRDASIQFIIIAILFFLLLLFFERMHKYFLLNRFTKALYLIYWFAYIIVFVIYITYVLTTWVFPNTPDIVLIAIFLFVCFYASVSRPETAVNIGVVLLPMLVLFIIFMLLAIPNLHVTNLLPLFHDRSNTWMLGFVYSTYAFGGAETYVMLRKYVLKDEKINKKVLTAYWVSLTSFYLLALLFTLMFFSLEEIKLIPEPILYILHSQEVTFVKRLDLFFSYIWLSWSLVAIVNYALVMRLIYFEKKRKAPRLQQLIFFIVIGVAATILTRFEVLDFLKHYVVYANLIFTVLLPIIIILVNKIRGRTVSESDMSS
ncbi:spore gernimation protein [Lysinibacillus sp. 2017]|uniref:GerAB/ArcD/ProY family transporter n=1 Tax=unclassified Lysinibacillus TaxID=2636778 RepID=UPI000D52A07C|nr:MULTISPECIES: GerAB/ArcD/ProY family transporter [unclassified Lysinibacillus]AWE08518.1 spore gernimation protein [Lysinibacillus sp. 2017]TGN35611.1 spore gernimation protein [Lysinibacillus sp. S2017]